MGSYDDYVKKKLEESPTIRHLFSRIGKEIVIQTNKLKVRGILKSIDISYRIFEVLDKRTNKVYFIKWRWVDYLKSDEVKFKR